MESELPFDALKKLRDLASEEIPPEPATEAAPQGLPPFAHERYRLLRELGRGASGVVYEAEDRDLRRRVAIKFLRAEGDDFLPRFRREAMILAQLKHPNIVGVHEIGERNDTAGLPRHFIVMEFVEGSTFARLLRERIGGISSWLSILEDVARAVDYAHAQGIVHRDLKPANLLVDKAGRVVLTDFGLARESVDSTKLTLSNVVMGTPEYMAPEQVEGRTADIGPRSDVYALGAILYEAVTGVCPHSGSTVLEVFAKISNEEPVLPRRRVPGISRDLEAVILRALQRDPAKRYPTAGELAEELRRIRLGEPVAASHITPWYPLRLFLARRRRLLLSVTGVALTAILLTAFGMDRWREMGFRRNREEALRNFSEGRWADALLSCERALTVREDESLLSMAADCRSRLEEEATRQREKIAEGDRFRRVQDQIRPFESLIRETRAFFYVRDVDLTAKLERVEIAVQELEKLTTQTAFENSPEVWTAAGIGWYLIGDGQKAEAALMRAEKLGSQDAWVDFYLGRVFLDRATLSHALNPDDPHEEFEKKSHEWSEKAAHYLERRGRAWDSASELDRALAELYRAIATKKGKKEVAALCEEGLKRFGAAIGTEEFWIVLAWFDDGARREEYCTKAIERKPQFAWAYFLRAQAKKKRGDFPAALQDLDEALRINPKLLPALINRGTLRMKTGDPIGSVKDYNRALTIDENLDAAWTARGILKAELGDPEGAMADFDQAIRINPRAATAYLNRGLYRGRGGDVLGARSDVETALEVASPAWRYRADAEELLRRILGE